MRAKRFWICIVFIVMLVLLTGCAGTDNNGNEKINVVCTNFPAYDFVMNIIGEESDIEVTYLLEKGVDMHNYQASAEAIARIMKADLCIYVGGESEEWVEDVLFGASENLRVVRFMDVVELKEEVLADGMEHEHEDGHEEHEHDKVVYDEHVWLSLKNATEMVEAVCEALTKIDEENADTYRANADKYLEELEALDAEYEQLVASATNRTIVVADRFPFLYLAEDYGIEYFAAFPGCSAETEAGFETIVFLAEKVKEYNLPIVFQIETSNGSLVTTVINAAGADGVKAGILDSMQSVSKEKAAGGYSYISAMRNNLSALKEALQ